MVVLVDVGASLRRTGFGPGQGAGGPVLGTLGPEMKASVLLCRAK